MKFVQSHGHVGRNIFIIIITITCEGNVQSVLWHWGCNLFVTWKYFTVSRFASYCSFVKLFLRRNAKVWSAESAMVSEISQREKLYTILHKQFNSFIHCWKIMLDFLGAKKLNLVVFKCTSQKIGSFSLICNV